jgi:hypothetical protein
MTLLNDFFMRHICFVFGSDTTCAQCGRVVCNEEPILLLQFDPMVELSAIPVSSFHAKQLKTARRSWRRNSSLFNSATQIESSDSISEVTSSTPITPINALDEGFKVQSLETQLSFAKKHKKKCFSGVKGWFSQGPKSLYGKYIGVETVAQDAWFHSLEALSIGFYQMCRARNWADQMVAIVAMAKMLDTQMSMQSMSIVTLTAILGYFFPPEQKQTTDGLKVQSMEGWSLPTLDGVEDWLEYYKQIRTSKCYTKVYRFFMYALSLSLLSKFGIDMDVLGFEPIAQAAIKAKYHKGEDFVFTMLDTMTFVCKQGYQCYATGSMQPLFHSSDKYQEWIDHAELMNRRALLLCNAQAHGFDKFSYIADLKSAIEKGESIRKCAERREDKLMIGRLVNTLKLNLDAETTKRAAQKIRSAPFAMLVYGKSSVGKSSFTDICFKHYGKVRKLQTGSEYRYTRNPGEEFWSGYSTSQWCIVMDDIGFLSPSLGTMDPSLQELLYVVNNTPYVPAQAELADKGRTPVMAELVIGTTNTIGLNVHAYFSCPLAVQRRFPYVLDVKPKAEYQDDAKPGMLASHKRPPSTADAYDDLWEITVNKVVPSIEVGKPDRGALVEVCTFQSMREFLPWYNTQILEHHKTQEIVKDSLEHAGLVDVCECNMPKAWCTCLTVQSHEMDLFGEQEMQEQSDMLSRLNMDATALTTDAFLHRASYMTSLIVCFYAFLYKYVHCIGVFNFFFSLIFGDDWFWRWVMASKHKWVVTRDIMRHLGAYTQARFGYAKQLATACGVIASCYAVYRGGKACFDLFYGLRPQGSEMSVPAPHHTVDNIGVKPVPDGKPPKNTSYHDPLSFNVSDLSQTSLCSAGQDGTVLEKHITKATVVFKTLSDKVRVTTAVNVRGNVYMCNAHAIPPNGDFYLDIIDEEICNVRPGLSQILVTESMVHRVPNKDLAFIVLRVRPPGSNLTEYFCTETYTAMVDAKYIGRQVDGKIWKQDVRNVFPSIHEWPVHKSFVRQATWEGKVQNETLDGHCGTLLWSTTPKGQVLLGIHTLGRNNTVVAMRVTLEAVKAACDLLEPKFVNRGEVTISAPSKTRVLGPLHPQSTIHRSNPGSANVMGSFQKEHRQQSKTNVQPTFISESCVKRGYEVERTKPEMGREPWRLALNDMTRPVTLMRNDVLECAVNDFIESTPRDIGNSIQVYSLDVALNGADGVRYCDKLNRKTSAGAPYKCPKKRFLFYVDEEFSTDVGVVDEIKGEIQRMIDTYQRGERVHPIYCGHLKDEPVSFEKALMGKTRLFTASGLAHTLVTRMYLLSVIVYMQNNRYAFEMGPGIVVQSLEWDQLHSYITKFGEDRIVAGDYSKFDKRMPATVILAAFNIIIDLCERAGYTREDIAVVRGIAYDTAYPVVDFHGDLIEFFGSNPSGHPLTVVINGLANSLYMRYVFSILRPIGSKVTFKEYVNLMTYGDDNIMGVSKDIPWFNHTAIQKVLADVDIGYTMADKEALSVPYIHISQANFLKRTWRYDEDIKAMVAPLDETSIAKMLTICVGKPNVSPQAHSIAVISTALREYFWYGREVFEKKTILFQEIVEECGLELYVMPTTFPSWQSLHDQFWENSEIYKHDDGQFYHTGKYGSN